VNILDGVFAESMAFAYSEHAADDVRQFVVRTLGGWRVEALGVSAGRAARLVTLWAREHEPAPVFRVEVTWDGPVLQIELTDRGAVVPNVNTSRDDAEFGMQLLGTAALEWGSELDSRGRCLWVSFRASPGGEVATPS
jgi:hypothetical protein